MIVSHIPVYMESNLSHTRINIPYICSGGAIYSPFLTIIPIELKKFFIKFCIKRYYKHNFFTSNREPFVTFNVIDSMPRE